MAVIHICHDLIDKEVSVQDGCRLEVIQQEVLKRLVTITGLSKIQCEAAESCQKKGYMLYTVDVKAPTGATLFSLWVRWYEDGKSYA